MKLRLTLLVALALVILVFTCCSGSNTNETNNTKNIGEWSFTVEIAGSDPITFTNEDALKIGPTEIKAAQKDKETLLEEETWEGILMNSFLQYIGVTEYSVISVEAADGFTRELEPADITETGTGFGWMVNGEMLDAERGPIQFIAHERGAKWWVKQVAKVTIIK